MADAAKEAEEAAKKEKEKELARAAGGNEAEELQRLLEEGVSADAKDGKGRTALWIASQFGNDDCTAALLSSAKETGTVTGNEQKVLAGEAYAGWGAGSASAASGSGSATAGTVSGTAGNVSSCACTSCAPHTPEGELQARS